MNLVGDYGFEDSLFHDNGREWDASTLYEAVKSQKIRAYQFPLKYYNMTIKRYNGVCDVADMAHHVKRCLAVDLSIPIILCPDGSVLDGYHRITMALAQGLDFVMAYRLKEMPPPDRVDVE